MFSLEVCSFFTSFRDSLFIFESAIAMVASTLSFPERRLAMQVSRLGRCGQLRRVSWAVLVSMRPAVVSISTAFARKSAATCDTMFEVAM